MTRPRGIMSAMSASEGRMAATLIITAGSRCPRTYEDTDLWSFPRPTFRNMSGHGRPTTTSAMTS